MPTNGFQDRVAMPTNEVVAIPTNGFQEGLLCQQICIPYIFKSTRNILFYQKEDNLI